MNPSSNKSKMLDRLLNLSSWMHLSFLLFCNAASKLNTLLCVSSFTLISLHCTSTVKWFLSGVKTLFWTEKKNTLSHPAVYSQLMYLEQVRQVLQGLKIHLSEIWQWDFTVSPTCNPRDTKTACIEFELPPSWILWRSRWPLYANVATHF